MTEVIALEGLSGDADATAGPKMATLARLAARDLSVPPGFVVTAEAFRRFSSAEPLAETIEAEMSATGEGADADGLERASARIGEAILGTALPADLSQQIDSAYERLAAACGVPEPRTAVRSSATAEDSAAASFAGQHDSYLGLSGAADVRAGVRRCWASLFNARALSYRLRHGISHLDCPMAVGVLELVPARASGVAFSTHPVTGRRGRMVIEASFGWGEAVVQGLVRPDHAEVGTTDRRLLRYDVAHKEVISTFDAERGEVVETPMPDDLRERRVLDDEEIEALVDAVLRIESMFDRPVDVEWVFAEGRRPGEPVTIVQARPQTGGGESQLPTASPAENALRYAFGSPPARR